MYWRFSRKKIPSLGKKRLPHRHLAAFIDAARALCTFQLHCLCIPRSQAMHLCKCTSKIISHGGLRGAASPSNPVSFLYNASVCLLACTKCLLCPLMAFYDKGVFPPKTTHAFTFRQEMSFTGLKPNGVVFCPSRLRYHPS